MVHAFILVKSAPGKDKAVEGEVSKVKGVKETHPVTGPYDLVAIVEVSELKEIGNLVREKIRVIDGVIETLTLICVSC
ncbi:Lrp/AsnC family transcriptional regulator [Candidatus Bathyarchaeota archaeon]|nr:MAG: Lrp/AsnC family transcriptional regulator [Candidatus Bathyarchaeota archaeon]